MKLFDKGAEGLFRKSSGKTVFYPYGQLSNGYLITSDADYQRILGKIKAYNKNLFFYLLIPLLGSAFAIQFVHADNNLLIVALLSVYTAFWSLQYYWVMHKETASLKPIENKSSTKGFILRYAFFIGFFALVYYAALQVQEIIFSAT